MLGRKVVLLRATQAEEDNPGPAAVDPLDHLPVLFGQERTERRRLCPRHAQVREKPAEIPSQGLDDRGRAAVEIDGGCLLRGPAADPQHQLRSVDPLAESRPAEHVHRPADRLPVGRDDLEAVHLGSQPGVAVGGDNAIAGVAGDNRRDAAPRGLEHGGRSLLIVGHADRHAEQIDLARPVERGTGDGARGTGDGRMMNDER